MPTLFKSGRGISTRTMHQSTTPSLSRCIWLRWASRQFVTLPIVQTLLPVTFGYSLSSGAVVMRQLKRWKRLWRRSLTRSRKRTFMRPSRSYWNCTISALQLEEITSKGLGFHVCTINKSANTKNVLKIIVCNSYIPKKQLTHVNTLTGEFNLLNCIQGEFKGKYKRCLRLLSVTIIFFHTFLLQTSYPRS